MSTVVYIVIRYWPGGKVEYLGASFSEETARRFAVTQVTTDGSNYVAIHTTKMVDEDVK